MNRCQAPPPSNPPCPPSLMLPPSVLSKGKTKWTVPMIHRPKEAPLTAKLPQNSRKVSKLLAVLKNTWWEKTCITYVVNLNSLNEIICLNITCIFMLLIPWYSRKKRRFSLLYIFISFLYNTGRYFNPFLKVLKSPLFW